MGGIAVHPRTKPASRVHWIPGDKDTHFVRRWTGSFDLLSGEAAQLDEPRQVRKDATVGLLDSAFREAEVRNRLTLNEWFACYGARGPMILTINGDDL